MPSAVHGDTAARIEQHFEKKLQSGEHHALRKEFTDTHYCEVANFVPQDIFESAREELESAFVEHARRKDLIVEQSGNTPRTLTGLNRDTLHETTSYVQALYRSPALKEFLGAVVEEDVHEVPYTPEEYVASRLHETGDVHGWHWDDFTWGLIWLFKTPDKNSGGELEYVKDAPNDPARLNEIVAEPNITRRNPGANSAYLLKTDTSVHRVAPLSSVSERMIACYAYASKSDLSKPVNHESMEQLYPASTSGA